MIYDKIDQVIEEGFESLLNRYQIWLKTSIRDSDCIFDYVNLLHYKCHKINLKRVQTYIDSPKWTRNKKATKKPYQWWW